MFFSPVCSCQTLPGCLFACSRAQTNVLVLVLIVTIFAIALEKNIYFFFSYKKWSFGLLSFSIFICTIKSTSSEAYLNITVILIFYRLREILFTSSVLFFLSLRNFPFYLSFFLQGSSLSTKIFWNLYINC
ncbi:hypothetical protein L2E82_05884 [Cichorium intybus]|uniref:Uncharacterized protein n=1 Tax=Cichorium intybus TaxID=13427 RepID=A0ACB9H8E7_CICIN|nr:hypothetical protein L2E82_05884 [Cichorium intybus]